MNNQEYRYLTHNKDIQITLNSVARKLETTYRNLDYLTLDDIKQDLLLKAIDIIQMYKDKTGEDSIESSSFNKYLNTSLNNYWIDQGRKVTNRLPSRDNVEVTPVLDRPYSLLNFEVKIMDVFNPPELTEKAADIYFLLLEAPDFLVSPEDYIKQSSGKINCAKIGELLNIPARTVQRAFK